ncbi:MAG: antitoxin [Micropruina sp.]|uniref:type II toxin-antitoxin system VapB family antitoxin n=1 Tax=Micropruina sp. TaxID=2737536 RepID=UPI0039E33795
MADVLIRNVSADTLQRIDSAAAQEGLSRTAYLRRQLDAIANPLAQVTMDDLRRSAELARGVLDEDVMRGAWD